MISTRDVRLVAFAAIAPLCLRAADASPVACQGRIIPASRIVNVAAYSETGAAVVATLKVAEGAEVKAGDVLAELASLPVAKARLAEAEAEVASARIATQAVRDAGALALGEANLALEDARAALLDARREHARRQVSDAQIAELDAALAAKTAEIARLKESRPVFVARADKSVAAAKASVDVLSGDAKTVAEAELAKAAAARELAFKDYDTRIAGETDGLAVLKARLAHGRELNALPQVSAAALAAAETRVKACEVRVTLEGSRTAAETGRAEAAERAAGARVATLAAVAGTSLVRAPLAGRILRINTRPGEAASPSGVVEMADVSRMIVLAEVSAPDLPRVKAGEKAEIRVPGLDKPLTGKVVRVGSLIGANSLVEEDPSAFRDLRVAAVEVALDDASAVTGLIRAQVTVRIVP